MNFKIYYMENEILTKWGGAINESQLISLINQNRNRKKV